jgi:hypothetical protein
VIGVVGEGGAAHAVNAEMEPTMGVVGDIDK